MSQQNNGLPKVMSIEEAQRSGLLGHWEPGVLDREIEEAAMSIHMAQGESREIDLGALETSLKLSIEKAQNALSVVEQVRASQHITGA